VSFVVERLEERVGRWSGNGAVGRVGDDGREEEVGWEVRGGRVRVGGEGVFLEIVSVAVGVVRRVERFGGVRSLRFGRGSVGVRRGVDVGGEVVGGCFDVCRFQRKSEIGSQRTEGARRREQERGGERKEGKEGGH